MRSQLKGGALSAEAFLAGLAAQARNGYTGTGITSPEGAGMVDLVNLAEAAQRLSWRVLRAEVAWFRARGRHKKAAHDGFLAVRREVMADIDAHTVGAPFRFDTPHGPLFNFDPLFVAAGESGSHMSGRGEGADEPTWAQLRAVAA